VAVAVYGQLDRLLRERSLTVADLKRQIEERYGLDVDALDGLTGPHAVQQADMTVAAAAALVLGVELGDLFAVDASAVDLDPALESQLLDEEPIRRIRALLDLQEEQGLSEPERQELETLVAEREAVTQTSLDRLGRDPQRLRDVVMRARRRRAAATR
jgi:hypothetical protein